MSNLLFVCALVGIFAFSNRLCALDKGEIIPNELAKVTGYSVDMQYGTEAIDNNYNVMITIVLKTLPDQGVIDVLNNTEFEAKNISGEKIKIRPKEEGINIFPSKIEGKLAYTCRLFFSLPQGNWSISGDLSVQYGSDIKEIPLVISNAKRTIVYKDKNINISGKSLGFKPKNIDYVLLDWSGIVPLAHLKFCDQNNEWQKSKLGSSQMMNGVTYVTFDIGRFSLDANIPAKIVLWSKFETKNVPIKFDIAVGMSSLD